MKQAYLAGLLAGLLALPGATRAQPTALPTATGPVPLTALGHPGPAAGPGYRAALGGPPQAARPQAADTAASASGLARLRQLHLPAYPPVAQPGRAALSVAELARLFPEAVRQQPGFVPDVAAPATAAAMPGSRALLVLALAPGAAGVPAGGAAAGQHLQLRGAAGEVVVAVLAQPAAAGSRRLVVRGAPGLAGQPVYVVGLEHPAAQTIDYEALALLGLGAAQELVGQLATVQQQLAGLRQQLAAARQLNGGLLLDHVELQDLRDQLRHLQVQQAAAFSAAHRRPATGWAAE